MGQDELTRLRYELELKQQELDLILAIDHVRDTAPDPLAMLSGIVNVLADQLQTDLCLLCLLDRETGELRLKAVNDRGQRFGQLEADVVRILTERSLNLTGVAIWRGEEVPEVLRRQEPSDTLELAIVPIVMGDDEHLGTLLLARSHNPFRNGDVRLLEAAESQIDSAVIQGYRQYELQQRNKELETIYRVDRIRDQHLSFDDMLETVLQELRAVIQAEMAFVMLYNPSGERLEMRAATHDDLFRVSPHYETVVQVANEALERARLLCYDQLEEGLRSLMCIPLILNDRIIGVLGVANRYGPHGFEVEDRRLLHAIASQMDTAIFESLEQRRLREVLGRSVDPRVMQRLLASSNVDFLKGERAEVSVLYSDIRGSTALAERTEPELFVGFINHYLGQMTEVILGSEGTLDKFVGDEVMALFGAPFPQEDHALRSVRVGLAMQEAHQKVIDTWRRRGVDAAPIGVGIATGELTVGEMGCEQRADYTVIGQAANLGARICSAAKAGQVLVSQETYDCLQGRVEARPITGLRLKGVSDEVTAYHVTRLLV